MKKERKEKLMRWIGKLAICTLVICVVIVVIAYYRPTGNWQPLEMNEEIGQELCAVFDGNLRYITNGEGVRCMKFRDGKEIEFFFQPLEHWQGVYKFDYGFVSLPNACHSSDSDCFYKEDEKISENSDQKLWENITADDNSNVVKDEMVFESNFLFYDADNNFPALVIIQDKPKHDLACIGCEILIESPKGWLVVINTDFSNMSKWASLFDSTIWVSSKYYDLNYKTSEEIVFDKKAKEHE